MSLRLVQMHLVCPKHGLRMLEVLKEHVEITEGVSKPGWSQIDHFCQQCDIRKFVESLRNCSKIELIDTQSGESPTAQRHKAH